MFKKIQFPYKLAPNVPVLGSNIQIVLQYVIMLEGNIQIFYSNIVIWRFFCLIFWFCGCTTSLLRHILLKINICNSCSTSRALPQSNIFRFVALVLQNVPILADFSYSMALRPTFVVPAALLGSRRCKILLGHGLSICVCVCLDSAATCHDSNIIVHDHVCPPSSDWRLKNIWKC